MNDLFEELANHPLHRAIAVDDDPSTLQSLIALHIDQIDSVVDIDSMGEHVPLSLAIRLRRFHAIKLLTSSGADVNCFGTSNGTDSHPVFALAALCDDACAIQALITGGMEVEVRDNSNCTLCHYAARNKSEKVLAALIAARAPISAPSDSGRLPTHFAAENSNEAILALLIDAGADYWSRDGSGCAPIHVAAQNRNEKVIARLLAASDVLVDVYDNFGVTPCHRAVSNLNLAVLAQLIEARCDVNCSMFDGDSWKTPVHLACVSQNNAALAMLIAAKADVNAPNRHGCSPLRLAANNENAHGFAMLASAGAIGIGDVDTKGRSLFHTAAANESMTRTVIALGVDVNARDENGETPCHYVAEKGNVECIRALLAAGASLDAVDHERQTVSHKAARNWHAEVLEFVLSLNIVDVDARDSTGSTPLHVAAEHARVRNVLALLDAGADVDAVRDRGFSVLHIAAKFLYPFDVGQIAAPALRRMLELGANVRWTNDDGDAPMHAATSTALALLFAWGADVHVRNKRQLTPLQLAAAAKWRGLARLATLVAAGADAGGLKPRELESASETIAEREWVLFRLRAHHVCIGLESLELPALVTCEILAYMFAPRESTVSFHRMWTIATLVKHFEC